MTKFKVRLTKKYLLRVMQMEQKRCICVECLHKMKEDNVISCVCPQLDLPCVALKNKYSSEKAVAKLVLDRTAVSSGKYLVITYDDELIDTEYVNTALEKYPLYTKNEEENTNG